MAPALHIVHSIDHTENFMSRVFTEEFAARLETINRVARELRAMGYRTVREHIGQGREVPTIEVDAGNTRSVAPLLDLAGGSLMRQKRGDGVQCLSIAHEGVRIQWEQC